MIILAAVIVVLVVFHAQQAREWSRERARFVHALLSRGPADFAVLERLADGEPRRMRRGRRELTEDGQPVDEVIPVGL